jgi:hypothetical protein
MSKSRGLAIWLLEMFCEAVGTTLWIAALAFIFIRESPPLHNDLSIRIIVGISAVVLMEFALTGYLLTTALAALYLPRTQRILYPLISGVLYLIHSTIFFVGAGNHILDKQNLSIQIGGACIAVGVTLTGDRLRQYSLRTASPN